jgi:hypothetical protein
MTIVIDIAWDRPTVAQIQATGATGVLRYLSSDPTKNLTAAEVHDYHAAGLAVGTVWETTASRATQGYQAGIDDGNVADGQRQQVGLPADHPIYAAVDTDTDWASCADYFRGFAAVIGQQRTGVYGGFRVVEGAYGDGYRLLWQTLAWSGGQVSKHACLYQDGRTVLSGNADVNQVLAADWGQYPHPTPAEADVNLTDKMPSYAGIKQPNGTTYIPTVGECLNGAKQADSKLDALDAKVSQVLAAVGADKAELDALKTTVGQVLTAVQGILSAGNATVAEVETAISAELAKLGAALGGIK